MLGDNIRKHTPVRSQSLHNLTLILLFLAVSLVGCSFTESLAVDDYLNELSEIQYTSDEALLELGEDTQALGGGLDEVRETIPRLEASRQSVFKAEKAIRDMDAPEAAQALKNDLVALYGEGGSLLEELIRFGNYRLEFEPLLDTYEASAKSFSDEVEAAESDETLIVAIGGYEKVITDTSSKGQVLEPPELSANSHARFISNMETLRQGLKELTEGIVSRDAESIEAAIAKLEQVSGDNQELQQAMSADRERDTQAFNARINKITAQSHKVMDDQAELLRELNEQ